MPQEQGVTVTPQDLAMLQDNSQVNNFVEFAEMMVHDDENIPLWARKEFWGFINKENVLSRSNDKDRRRSENRFRILSNLDMMSHPAYHLTIKRIRDLQNVMHRNTIETNRSLDGFERQALTTQIKQIITNARPDSLPDNSFMGKVKKKLGFGKKDGED